jgi:predicted CopG family antitoxin
MKKSIIVNEEVWKKLAKLKIDLDKRTISEVIEFLLEERSKKGEK